MDLIKCFCILKELRSPQKTWQLKPVEKYVIKTQPFEFNFRQEKELSPLIVKLCSAKTHASMRCYQVILQKNLCNGRLQYVHQSKKSISNKNYKSETWYCPQT
jgi:hypothetical protein